MNLLDRLEFKWRIWRKRRIDRVTARQYYAAREKAVSAINKRLEEGLPDAMPTPPTTTTAEDRYSRPAGRYNRN